MKKCVLFIVAVVVLSFFQFGVEKTVFENGLNFGEKLADNNLFFQQCRGLALQPENNLVYFLDSKFCKVFKVALDTGKLVKSIGSRGQGPAELHIPIAMKVKNGKVFVLDRGFNGIKIFDTEGTLINEFKLEKTVRGNSKIDVNGKDEIYLANLDRKANRMITVFNLKGEKLRGLIPFKTEKNEDREELLKKGYRYIARLDANDNIYLLSAHSMKLFKYDSAGKKIWETDITNKILEDYFKESDKRQYIKKNPHNTYEAFAVYQLDILKDGSPVVGHVRGGCIFTPEGKLKKLIAPKAEFNDKMMEVSLELFMIKDGVLMNVWMFGREAHQYKFEEEKG